MDLSSKARTCTRFPQLVTFGRSGTGLRHGSFSSFPQHAFPMPGFGGINTRMMYVVEPVPSDKLYELNKTLETKDETVPARDTVVGVKRPPMKSAVQTGKGADGSVGFGVATVGSGKSLEGLVPESNEKKTKRHSDLDYSLHHPVKVGKLDIAKKKTTHKFTHKFNVIPKI